MEHCHGRVQESDFISILPNHDDNEENIVQILNLC